MVNEKQFGVLDGCGVVLLELKNEQIGVELLNYGATIRSIFVQDRNGAWVDVCLGYDTPQEYAERDGYLGATIGRNANRIANASVVISGKEYNLTPNEGENQLHGGRSGFNQKLWSYHSDENGVTFSLESPDGEEGFPGNLSVEVTYRLEGRELQIEYRAKSDQDTIVNLTNHTYFNLGGQDGGKINDHMLSVFADYYTPVNGELIPTGEIAPVDGTPLDLRKDVTMNSVFENTELAATNGLDHNFVLNKECDTAASLYCPRTGIGLEVETTLEGIQIYSSGALTRRTGKMGAIYEEHHAVCLETQHFPDAIHHAKFPSPILRCGEEYLEKTTYRFFLNG